MSALLRQYLWIGVVVAVAVGVIAAMWLAGVAAGPAAPVVPPNIG
jgi:predicted outer membrane lipoprotein